MSLLFTNIRSVIGKRTELSSVVDSCNTDIVILTETWLSAKIKNNEILECEKTYTFYRFDRDVRSGGGVLIAVSDTLVSSSVLICTALELVCVRVTICNRDFIFCACYRPPTTSPSFCSDLHDALNQLIVRYPNAPLFLLGDFNFPDIVWNSDSITLKHTSSECSNFINLCHDFNLSQMVHKPTRISASSSNTLDLILTTTPNLISPLTYLSKISEHLVLHFTLEDQVPSKKTVKIFQDYSRANIELITTELEQFTEEFLENFEERSVNENWSLYRNKLLSLMDKHVPKKKICSNPRSPWFSNHLGRLRNKKKRLFRKAKRANNAARWMDYQRTNAEYTKAVRNAKQNFFNNTLPTLLQTNPRKFWNIVGGTKTSLIQLNSTDDVPVPVDECCTVLNNVFSAAFNGDAPACLPVVHSETFERMDSLTIDWPGVRKLITDLKISSSSGPDSINSKMLKCTELCSAIILSKLFAQSLQQSALPADWIRGKVVPVHKSGDSHFPGNYRPISLTSIPCKMFEHILCSHLIRYLESNSFFSNCQHGFRKYLSCETQLLSFTNDLFINVDKGCDTDCVFLDFAKAFDSVSHDLLIHKLSKLNIDDNVLFWIKSFLSNRTQYVIANGFSSASSPVSSGVPQGSVLGPLLFLVYVNDLPSCVTHSSIKLFADDCVLYHKINCPDDFHELQDDLNSVSNWCERWLMKLNITKCKTMRISRLHNNPHVYNLNNIPLSSVDSYKYLGLHITKDLTWNMHVEYITNNANRMLGYLRRNFYFVPSDVKLTLYKSLVRPKLEYACAIWDPGKITLTQSIEAIQNRATRFILSNYSRNASVTSMKSVLGLPDLSARRKYHRLCLFQKIFFHIIHLKEQLMLPPTYISSRIDHVNKVGVPSCRTNHYNDSFIPRTSVDWNHLPASTAAISEHSQFKTALQNLIF